MRNSLDTNILRNAAEQSDLRQGYLEVLKSNYILVDVVYVEALGIIKRYTTIRKNILSMQPKSMEVQVAIDRILNGVPNDNDSRAIETIANKTATDLGLKDRANPDQIEKFKKRIAEIMRTIEGKMRSYITISTEQIIPFRTDEHFMIANSLQKKLNAKKDQNTINDIKIIAVSVNYAFESSSDVCLYSNDKFIIDSNASTICEIFKKIKPAYQYHQTIFKIKTLS